MKARTIFRRWIFTFLLFAIPNTLYTQSINFSNPIRGYETRTTLSFGLYKMYASSYIYLQKKGSTPIFNLQKESTIYKWLLIRMLFPRYLAIQATAHPLAMVSSSLETHNPDDFRKFEYKGWNILRAIGSGPEEPYAFSVLCGNFTFFGYRESVGNNETALRPAGSALAGFLVSFGYRHILDNIRLNDRWWQIEVILTGNYKKKNDSKIQWNFRVGAKFHEHKIVNDVVVLSLYRSHTEWKYNGFSLFRNSVFQYEAHFPINRNWRKSRFSVRQLLTCGKKFPFRLWNRFFAVRIGGGLLWECVRKYDHANRNFYPNNKSQLIWLIQPSVEF